jgi:AAA domain
MTGTVQFSWPKIRARARDAVEASLERLARMAPADPLSATLVALPAAGRDLEVWASMTRRWVDQQFFVVDADLDETRAENRHMVRLRRFEGKRLRLTLPVEARAGLGGAQKLRVFCVSDVEIRLKQALLRALKDATRGELVAKLWSPQRPSLGVTPKASPGGRALNDGQRAALGAITSPGGWLVWGPPGTGKTTVITAAVHDALTNGRSVLLASHTHVAVDNVLEGLFPAGDASGWPEPGTVIRVASTETQDRVSPAVRGHRYVMLDKAVAELTGQGARQASLDLRRGENRSHQVRERLRQVIEDLSGVDVERIERAQQVVQANAEAACLQPLIAGLEQQLSDLRAQLETHRETAQTMHVSAKELSDAQTAVERTRAELAGDQRALAEASAAIQVCARELATAGDQLRNARAAIGRGLGRVLGPVRERRTRQAADLETQAQGAQAALTEAKQSHQRWADVLATSQLTLTDNEQQLQILSNRNDQARRETQAADELASRLEILRGDHASQAKHLAELHALAARLPTAAALLAEAQQSGVLASLQQRNELNDQVAKLDKELLELDREQTRLDQEVADERARLLAETPVVACTLAALSMSQPLLKRRFDVVILDEVASIEAPYVAFAGSRADRTLALVGDFLQNAPIAEVDDITNEQDRARAEWQKRDIFHLVGIDDRATAESHPRCVALRTQYRYPSLIAQVVNAFCYDGLLQTSNPDNAPGDGPLITLLNTTGHPGNELQRERNSWWYQLGLDLLEVIAKLAAQHTSDIGYICPYAPQAHRAQRLSDREHLKAQCGTAHRFQGREFHTVIVDLMQDSHPRWTGVADLQGTERQVAAAKLLNVALTRTKTRLYLIGDWDFIQRYDTPGMQAIAALDGHPDFRITDAQQLTQGV